MPHHGQVIGWPQATTLPSYTVWLDGLIYYAMNNTTGAIDFQGVDPAVVVQACLTAGGAGTVVGLREAIYVALTGVAATANDQGVYGLGEGTYWDATALLTGTHAFTIAGFTGCGLRNFAIETDAGGGLMNHCVFINDGANDFHLIDLTIVDSDSDGIHIGGSTITQGHIHRCHVDGADDYGIRVDMDGLNFIYRLHIEDCDVGNCGVTGIYFTSSDGNLYCEVVNNIIYSCTVNGIRAYQNDHGQFRGNICLLNGGDGIEMNFTVHAQVLGNICYQNVQHGIFLVNSDYCTVEANTCVENDSGDTNTYDGLNLYDSTGNLVSGNMCLENDRHGIFVDGDSDNNKIHGNYLALNPNGDITVGGAACDHTEIVWNTIEDGAIGDAGALTRASGNFDPSANAYIALIGAAPF